MGIVFYYSPMSSATRVHWALEELAVPYDKVKVDLAAGEQRKPELLKVNPNGKVPAMLVDGVPLFESLAMLLHLGEQYGVDKGLFPPPGMARMEAFKWMVWGSVSLSECLTRFLRNSSERWPAEQRSAGAAEAARIELGHLLGLLEGQLTNRSFVLGPEFSLADCGLATTVSFIGRMGIDLSAHVNVGAWVGRCLSRPAFGRAMAG